MTSESEFSRDRAHRALLATRQNELLTPVHGIVDLAERLLADPRTAAQARFRKDVSQIRAAAIELRSMAERALNPSDPESLVQMQSADRQRRVRHDLVNRLNPVINYSEMWLEDAADCGLEPFVSDLTLIRSLGKRALALIDALLSPEAQENSQGGGEPLDLRAIEQTVARLTAAAPAQEIHLGSILVVDDNEINRDILGRFLTADGHSVSYAATGLEGIEKLRHEPFDLVLLDIIMPEMDGFAMLLALKTDPLTRDVPVIMISALNEMEYIVNCVKMGAEDYLTRPYNQVFLRARVNAVLEKKRLREREQRHLAEIDRERRRADRLLHDILPERFVDELKRENVVRPRRYDHVAVLFADLVGFTRYCERNSPDLVVERLQQLIEAWEEAAALFGVQKIKTIGDAFMAACGILVPTENPVASCVRFGESILGITEKMTPDWALRIGIHVGPVVGGVLGRQQYLFDVFGDTVNTAARMESHGVSGRIVLTRRAWDEIAGQATAIELEPVEVKGKGIVPRFQFEGFLGLSIKTGESSSKEPAEGT
jgi:adenylate cyclase